MTLPVNLQQYLMKLNVTRVFASFLLPALFYIPNATKAQTGDCPEGETEIIIEISPDDWPGEISWDLIVCLLYTSPSPRD